VGDELLFLLFRVLFALLFNVYATRTALTSGDVVDVKLDRHLGTLGELEGGLLLFRFLLVLALVLALVLLFLFRLLVARVLLIILLLFGLEGVIIYPNDGCIVLTKVVTFRGHPCCLPG
jgi:hypothetical protein